MPEGKVHNFATLVVATTSVATLIYQSRGEGIGVALACGAGALMGLVCHPDWDLDGQKPSFSELIERPAGFAWRLFLRPYAIVCKHRSVASHFPIISTLGRLAYVALWLSPIWICNQWTVPRLEWWMPWGLLGLCLADTAHWLLDKIDESLGGKL